MGDIEAAIREEKAYHADRLAGISTNFAQRLRPFGYTIDGYFSEKKRVMFERWEPEVFRVDETFLDNEMEQAICDGKYGIYIIDPTGPYAFHGNDEIDRDLCNKIDIRIIEMGYNGGTIIGDQRDLGILIVAPVEMGLTSISIIEKFRSIIEGYVGDAKVAGNDVIVGGYKVLGSMSRAVGGSFVWAAQVSFADHSDVITQVCCKRSLKTPGYIDSPSLDRDSLEAEVLSWLLKH